MSVCVSVGISFFVAAEYDRCCNFMCCRIDHVTYLKQQETSRVKSGNFRHQVNSDSDLDCFIF